MINCSKLSLDVKKFHLLGGYFHHIGEKAKANRFITCLQDSKELGSPWLVWLSRLSTSFEPKGRWFNSHSGHMPGLSARFLEGDVREATTH